MMSDSWRETHREIILETKRPGIRLSSGPRRGELLFHVSEQILASTKSGNLSITDGETLYLVLPMLKRTR
jgi:hypothetical protein